MTVSQDTLAQQRQIEEARKILAPSPVELHKIPRWLSKRLHQARREGRLSALPGSSAETLLHAAVGGLPNGWLDHWGTTTYHGQEAFVSEPYWLDLDAAKAFAELLRLGWSYNPNSHWYPGYTFRIVFFLPADDNAT